MRPRVIPVLVGLTAGLGVALGAVDGAGELGQARAADAPALDDPNIVAVGTALVAVNDVTLRDAAISKGARVNVTKVVERQGRIAALDVELPDGHVVKRVPIDTIRASFAVAADP
jgi:hypothetical protein